MASLQDFQEARSAVNEDNTLSNQERAAYLGKIAEKESAFKTEQKPDAPEAPPLLPASPAKPQGVGLGEGLGNLWHAGINGLNQGATELGNIIHNPGPLMNQIGQSFQTEQQHSNPMANLIIPGGEQALGAGAGALQGTAQFVNGISGLPSMLQNAYEGKQVSQPAIQIPTGDLDQYIQNNHPVSGFAGSMVPLGVAETLTGGTATPEIAASKASALGGLVKAAGTGAAYGVLGTPGELEDRVKAGVSNAALGTVMHLAGQGLHAGSDLILKDETAPTSLNKLAEKAGADNEMVKDPATGKWTVQPKVDAGEAAPGVLTGHVSNTDPTTEGNTQQLAPWDTEEQEHLSPETGEPAQAPQQVTPQQAAVGNENHEAFGPSAQQDAGALNAASGIIQRQNQAKGVANQNHESFNPEPQQVNQAQSAVDVMRQRQAQLQAQAAAVANQNHESFGPNAQQDLGAMNAVEQMQARRQALAQAQQEQAIQEKAAVLHQKVKNFEQAGLTAQAKKLKAEVAEGAASHPDPLERAAYSQALNKIAPPKAEVPVQAPKVEAKAPEAKETIKFKPAQKPIKGEVSKTEVIPNEPQGQVQQPEGQQPTQGNQKAPAVAEQKPVEPSKGEKAVKQPSETQVNKKKLEQGREAVRLLQGHPDFGETNAHTVLKHDFGIDVKDAPYTGHVKNYRVFIPGKGYKTFQWDAPISSIDLHSLAGSIVNQEGGLQKLLGKVGELNAHDDLNINSPHEINSLLETGAGHKLEDHEQAENKLFESFDQHLADLKKADTFEEIERINEALEHPDYQHIYHGEVRKEVENAIHKAIERLDRPTPGEERPAPHGVDESHPADDRGSKGKASSEAKPTPKRIVNKDVPEVSFEQYLKSKGLKSLSDFEQADLIGGQAEMSARPVSGARKGKIDALAKRQAVIDEAHAEYQGKLKSGEIKSHAVTEEHDLNPDSPADQAYVRAMQRRKEKLDEYNKTTEVDQEALDAIFPDSKKKTESAPVEKPKAGAPLREHLEPAQAHKEGKFLSPDELENHPDFEKAYAKLSDKGREVVDAAMNAIDNKKKLHAEYYQPKTKTASGVLTKRAGYQDELYTPKGFTINKDGSISIKGYNENATMSTRDPNQFTGQVSPTTDKGYEGLYRHASDINEHETFDPVDAIVEQVANPFIKKQFQGKPVLESDYRQAYKTLRALVQEAKDANPGAVDTLEILKKMPDQVTEYFKGNPCK